MDTSLIKFLALIMIVLCLIPVVSVSCMDEEVVKYSTVELAVGRDKAVESFGEEDNIEADMVMSAMVALLMIIAGAALLWAMDDIKVLSQVKMGVYAIGMLAFIAIPFEVNAQIGADGELKDMVTSQNKFGYYLLLIAFAAMVFGLYKAYEYTKVPKRVETITETE